MTPTSTSFWNSKATKFINVDHCIDTDYHANELQILLSAIHDIENTHLSWCSKSSIAIEFYENRKMLLLLNQIMGNDLAYAFKIMLFSGYSSNRATLFCFMIKVLYKISSVPKFLEKLSLPMDLDGAVFNEVEIFLGKYELFLPRHFLNLQIVDFMVMVLRKHKFKADLVAPGLIVEILLPFCRMNTSNVCLKPLLWLLEEDSTGLHHIYTQLESGQYRQKQGCVELLSLIMCHGIIVSANCREFSL